MSEQCTKETHYTLIMLEISTTSLFMPTVLAPSVPSCVYFPRSAVS